MNPHVAIEFYARIDLLRLLTVTAYPLRGMAPRSGYAQGYWDAIAAMALALGLKPWEIQQGARLAEDDARSLAGMPLLYEGGAP